MLHLAKISFAIGHTAYFSNKAWNERLQGGGDMEQQVRRLVTRSDFDGLACAMMLKELQLIDEIKFVHP